MAYRYGMVLILLWATTTFGQIHIRDNAPESKSFVIDSMFFPVDGVLISGHGWRNGRIHHGLDISHNNRDTIFAAWNGFVRYKNHGYTGGYGNLVILRHWSDLETYYAHTREILVDHHQFVRKGQPIAIVGSTGNSLGPHLHFEVRYKGLSIDPAALRNKQRFTIIKNGQVYELED